MADRLNFEKLISALQNAKENLSESDQIIDRRAWRTGLTSSLVQEIRRALQSTAMETMDFRKVEGSRSECNVRDLRANADHH